MLTSDRSQDFVQGLPGRVSATTDKTWGSGEVVGGAASKMRREDEREGVEDGTEGSEGLCRGAERVKEEQEKGEGDCARHHNKNNNNNKNNQKKQKKNKGV